MPYLYKVFGLTFECEFPLVQLDCLEHCDRVDYTLSFRPPWPSLSVDEDSLQLIHQSPERSPSGEPALTIWCTPDMALFDYRFADGVAFTIPPTGDEILLALDPSASTSLATDHLLYWLIGFLLTIRERLCLHGAAVAIDGQAVALIGSSGAGKSTLTAVLASQGFGVFSDDFVAITQRGDQTLVHAGYPWIALRPTALAPLREMLPADVDGTPEWAYLEDRFWNLDLRRPDYRFQSDPLPLRAVYVLHPDSVPQSLSPISIHPKRHDYVHLLMKAATRMPWREYPRPEAEQLAELVSRVPIRHVEYAKSWANILELRNMILDDLQRLP